LDLSLTRDQAALRDAVAALFRKESPVSLVRASEGTGFDRGLWDLVVRAGFPAMGIAEELGGAAATPIDLAVVAQEYGRALAPVPLIEAIVAGDLLARAAPDSDLVTAVVRGEAIPALALAPVSGQVARMVPAGSLADIVIAYRDGALLAFPLGQEPLPARLPNLGDLPVADRWLSPDRAITLATGDRAAALFGDARTEWKLLTAAALNGLRERALDIGVDYVKSRVAFGVPLGWFQAVQHRLADDAVAGDGARLLMYEAAWARGERLGNADELVSMAFLYNAETAFRTSRTSLQFHGGYGFTKEYDIQLYFRRAKSWPLLLGPAPAELDYLAARLLGAPGLEAAEHGL
jgi:alkylation response protein AidB-like acyl-CoA dehydrogenase